MRRLRGPQGNEITQLTAEEETTERSDDNTSDPHTYNVLYQSDTLPPSVLQQVGAHSRMQHVVLGKPLQNLTSSHIFTIYETGLKGKLREEKQAG